MNWYLDVLRKYADFSGRARRMEYWMFVLFNLIIVAVLSGIDYALGWSWSPGSGALTTIYQLAVLLPSLAVTVRRLHDTGRSGWFVLLNFVPCVGWIILLVFTIQEGIPGENQYGPNPKAVPV